MSDVAPEAAADAAPEVARPRAVLVLHHIVKSSNLAALIRSADAFGIHEVLVVGRRKIPPAASVGMARCVQRVALQNLGAAEAYLRERDYRILGVEVDAAAARIETHPFVGDTAFVLGNEGSGLTDRHRAMCDALVRVPQYGHARSLNVNVAGAIVLHHFGLWAGYTERPIDGQKFVPSEDGPESRYAARRDEAKADGE